MKSPILGAAYVARSTNAADNRLINLYPESTPDVGKTAAYLQRVPGIRQVISFIPSHTATVRGLWVARDILYAVIGSSLYAYNFQYNSAGQFVSSTSTLISTNISGTGPVSMVDNGSQIFIATNPDGYIYNINTTVFAKIGDPDFPGAVTVGYINGYFVFNEPNSQRVWVTELFDGSSIEPLSFASAEASPDNVVSLIVDHKEIWIFGNNSTEVWYDAGQPDYPLAPIQGAFLETGCVAPYSVAKMDNSVFWLGSDARGFGMVYRARGYQPQRISTHAIEYAIQSYGTLSDAFGYTYQQDGHMFYVLTFPSADATWVYDAATNMWHQRQHVDGVTGQMRRHSPSCAIAWKNRVFVGDSFSRNIGHYDFSIFEEFDFSRRQPWLRSWRALPTNENNLKRTAQHSLQLDCEAATSNVPQPNQPAPGVQGPPWEVRTSDGTIYNVTNPVVLRSNGTPVVFVNLPFNLGPSGSIFNLGFQLNASLRWSDDGGHTWSNFHTTSMGFQGQTAKRVIWRRLGMTQKLRDRVYEVSGSGDGRVAIMGAELIASGTNA
jgi:hypothetical protein